MTKPKTLNATIPFSGFYASMHSDNIDRAINSYFDKEGTGEEGLEPENFYFSFNHYDDIHEAYAKKYVECFADWFEGETGVELPLTFETMKSPREYNFTTDRIFCDIPLSAIRKIRAYVPDDVLRKRVSDRFTSRDGFLSFYSKDLDDWQETPLSGWDHNQIGTLIEAALIVGSDSEEYGWEYSIMESALYNGRIDEIVYGYCAQWERENPLEAHAEAVQRAFDLSADDWKALTEEEQESYLERFNALPKPCENTLNLFTGG